MLTIPSQFLSNLAFLLMAGSFILSACGPADLPTLPPPSASPLPVSTATLIPSSTSTITPTRTPSPAPTATLAGCQQTSGRIVEGVIETELLDKPIKYNVYLPPCYDSETGQRYPILYLLHGQNFDEDQWLRIGATRTADRLIAAGEIPPLIIVMPFDHSFKQPSEYKFDEAFLTLLLPRIDADYRTRPDRQHRAIGGLSRGGAWAIHLGIRHPDLFGAIGAHSPAIFYSDTSTLPILLRDLPPEQSPQIFIDAGDHDVELVTTQSFIALLNAQDVSYEWHAFIGYHEEKYWSAHVEDYLRWYSAVWNE